MKIIQKVTFQNEDCSECRSNVVETRRGGGQGQIRWLEVVGDEENMDESKMKWIRIQTAVVDPRSSSELQDLALPFVGACRFGLVSSQNLYIRLLVHQTTIDLFPPTISRRQFSSYLIRSDHETVDR